MVPVNASLVRCTLDLCGRSSFYIEDVAAPSAASVCTAEIQALLNPLTQTAGICLHIELLKVSDARSIHEGILKSIGMCLANALTRSLRAFA